MSLWRIGNRGVWRTVCSWERRSSNGGRPWPARSFRASPGKAEGPISGPRKQLSSQHRKGDLDRSGCMMGLTSASVAALVDPPNRLSKRKPRPPRIWWKPPEHGLNAVQHRWRQAAQDWLNTRPDVAEPAQTFSRPNQIESSSPGGPKQSEVCRCGPGFGRIETAQELLAPERIDPQSQVERTGSE